MLAELAAHRADTCLCTAAAMHGKLPSTTMCGCPVKPCAIKEPGQQIYNARSHLPSHPLFQKSKPRRAIRQWHPPCGIDLAYTTLGNTMRVLLA